MRELIFVGTSSLLLSIGFWVVEPPTVYFLKTHQLHTYEYTVLTVVGNTFISSILFLFVKLATLPLLRR
jgi:hypothetical protein